ncbi:MULTISPECIES: lysylphosphatidylglycerol synthase domain-containing protein [Microbacterium]|uniref:Uncharacterized protein n=1 Tax=Microbacterium maritypicum MF109 TaxID=1333857 RepID=T5KMH5_MICMQ|nr:MULTISPECIES: lysylphosphatidylglycerol synthase domain-containing protein [Microbacterium]EQM76982.1 hypothetical protein L687_00705 [Microbacterium maritypicum MF109]NIG64814.1 UPF0104 family protein [Microbacterium sp. Be9]
MSGVTALLAKKEGILIAESRSARSWVLLILRYVLLALVLGFAAYYLISQWDEVSAAIKLIAWQSAVLSFLLVLAGLALGTISWIAILNGLGEDRVPFLRAAQILLVGQLGKYVPGSVWSYVMQMELGRQYNVSRPRVLITALYSAGVGVVASLILGALAVPLLSQEQPELLWLFALLPVGLICLHPAVMTWLASLVLKLFRRPPLDHRVKVSTVLIALSTSIGSYICYGLHLTLLVNSLADPDPQTVVLLTGAMAIGFSLSLFAFILPSGIGVREAVLVAAMATIVTVPQAAAVSAVSRMMFTVGDVAAAGVAVLFVIIMRRRLRDEGSISTLDLSGEHEAPSHEHPAAPVRGEDDAAVKKDSSS